MTKKGVNEGGMNRFPLARALILFPDAPFCYLSNLVSLWGVTTDHVVINIDYGTFSKTNHIGSQIN